MLKTVRVRNAHADLRGIAVAAKDKFQIYPNDVDNITTTLVSADESMFTQFHNAILNNLGSLMKCYRAASVFLPSRLMIELGCEEKNSLGERLDQKSVFLLRISLSL